MTMLWNSYVPFVSRRGINGCIFIKKKSCLSSFRNLSLFQAYRLFRSNHKVPKWMILYEFMSAEYERVLNNL